MAEKGIIKAWFIYLDKGTEHGFDIDLKQFGQLAKVNKRPNNSGEAAPNKRVLLQSITFNDFNQNNQIITAWFIDLDTGDEIPAPINVNSLVTGIINATKNEINEKIVTVEKDNNQNSPTYDKRVLMQSITYDDVNKEVIGWMINLDNGEKIPVRFTLNSLLELGIKVFNDIDLLYESDNTIKQNVNTLKDLLKDWLNN